MSQLANKSPHHNLELHCDYDNESTLSNYGYCDNKASCAHDYLLPRLMQELHKLSQGRLLKVVDLGCGNGYVAWRIAEQGHSVTGIDVSSDGIEIARASFPLISYHRCSVYDVDLLEKIGGPVDCVVSLEVVEHLFYPKRLFEQSRKILVNGGALIVSTPYHGYLKNLALSLTNGWDAHFSVHWDGGHIKFFSKKTLVNMASREGFANIRFYSVGRLPGLWKSIIMIADKKLSE